jgi:5-methylcytosine-specific restriction endonuclease McrA
VTERLRGRKAQERRRRLFAREPLCRCCTNASPEQPCYGHRKTKPHPVKAVWADHIVALDNGGPDSSKNLQPLSDECHQAKTRIDLGQRPRTAQIGADGWPIEGQ